MKSPLDERPLITEEHGIAPSHLSVAGKASHEDMTDQVEPDNPSGNAHHWFQVPSNFRTGSGPLPQPWEDRFGPLRHGAVDDLVVVGQIGQSIDGRSLSRNVSVWPMSPKRFSSHAITAYR